MVSPDTQAASRTKRAPLKLPAALAVIAILILLGVLQAGQFNQTGELRQQVYESYETRAQIQNLLSLHQDLETGQRGYGLTGNRSFLEPYRNARARLHSEFAKLRQRVADEPQLAGALVRLEQLSRRKLEFAERAIALRTEQGHDAVVALVAAGEGKRIMDEMRALIARMDSVERHDLEEATADADESRLNMQMLTYALEAALLLLLLAAAWQISRNLAAAQRTSERLRDLSTRQQAIFDAGTDGLIIHDPAGIIESLNPATAHMYGYSNTDLVGRHIGILFKHPPKQGDLEAFLGRLAKSPLGQASRVQEFGGRKSDGSLFSVDVATSPVQLADGLHFLAVVRDATERKRVERLKTEFVSTVSHELRTPLTSIAGSLGLLAGGAGGELPERAARLIKIAHANSERLVRLINDILDIEKIESGKMVFDVKPVPLRALAEQAIQANAAYAKDYGVTLRLEDGDEAAVMADPDRLMQVFTNLLSNAAKFSPPDGEVTMRIEPGEEMHRVCVIDRGDGIPEEFRGRIFSKFAQADSSDTRLKGGTGLGLSIVREIVTRLNGTVGFESEAGKGTVFHVDLPAAGKAVAPTAVVAPTPAQPRARILICHDDDAAAAEVRLRLHEAGLESDIAVDGAQVRALTAQTTYAAVLLDLTLPGEESISLIRHLRSDPRYASAPILIAAPDSFGKEVSQALAIIDWMHKPVSIERLVEGVEEAVSGRGQPCILHVEDDKDVLRVVASAFEGRAQLDSVTDLDEARAALKEGHYDLVILDIALPGGSGLELLPEMRRKDGSPIPVVIFSAQDDEPEIARRVEAMLTKSRASLNDLVGTVEAVLPKTFGEKE